jgi:hypothetical protein
VKALVIAAALLFAIVPASAQGPSFGDGKKAPTVDPAREAEADRAYKSSLEKIRPKEGASADPWGSVRPGDGNASSQNRSKNPASPAR